MGLKFIHLIERSRLLEASGAPSQSSAERPDDFKTSSLKSDRISGLNGGVENFLFEQKVLE
tara:strand:- start:169 stop:351 length:183 start_codon:yes stop_codon:yes gene_type:complete